MIVCFLHAKVGHCQALISNHLQDDLLKNPPREGFFVCTALVLKEKVLFFIKARCIVNITLLGNTMMKKLILCFGISLLGITASAQAEENSCNCSNKLSACPQENLSRGAETQSLKIGKRSDDLASGRQSENLNLGKKTDELNRGKEAELLMRGKNTDDLTRGKDAETLKRGDSSDMLTRGLASNDLSRGKNTDELQRGDNSDELSRGRGSDELARGRETEPLSRCN